VPVDQRLNELVAVLGAGGIHVTRSELVAALVVQSPMTAPELQEIVVRYSQQSAGSVVLQRRGAILLAQRRPGRRANY
jgi:hypothetical protein